MKKATKSYKFTAKTNSNGVDIRVNLSFSPNVQEEITWSHQLQKLLKNKSKGVNRKGLILSLAARFKDPETYNIGHQVKEWLRLFDENPQEIPQYKQALKTNRAIEYVFNYLACVTTEGDIEKDINQAPPVNALQEFHDSIDKELEAKCELHCNSASPARCVKFIHMIASDNAQLYKKMLTQFQSSPEIDLQRIAAWISKKGCKQENQYQSLASQYMKNKDPVISMIGISALPYVPPDKVQPLISQALKLYFAPRTPVKVQQTFTKMLCHMPNLPTECIKLVLDSAYTNLFKGKLTIASATSPAYYLMHSLSETLTYLQSLDKHEPFTLDGIRFIVSILKFLPSVVVRKFEGGYQSKFNLIHHDLIVIDFDRQREITLLFHGFVKY